MSKEIVFTIAEISKLSLQPGDVLNVKVMGDEFDEDTMRSLQQQYAKIFPNNKIAIFLLPRGNDIQMEVIQNKSAEQFLNEITPAPAKDCSVPTNYCNDCACGKKERIEGEEALEAKREKEMIEFANKKNEAFFARMNPAFDLSGYEIVESVQETIETESTGAQRLSEAQEQLAKRLEGRRSPRLDGLAKKAHDPEKQDQLLAHLDHGNEYDIVDSVKETIDQIINDTFKPENQE